MHTLDSYSLGTIAFGAIAFGIYLLVKGGTWTVDSASSIAEQSGLSRLFIGATIIAFGTSSPELFTSINANLNDFPGISLGNILGSNIANVLLIIGVTTFFAPIAVKSKDVRTDLFVMIAATICLALGVYYGAFPRLAGIAMQVGIVVYVFWQYRDSVAQNSENTSAEEVDKDASGTRAYLWLVIGIVTMLVGSEMIVRGAVAGGIALGVSEAVIGLTVVAFGTSLPELATCITAARRKQSDIIVGSIVGSNIFNILLILATTAVIKPLNVDSRFLFLDLPVVIVSTLLFAVFLFSGLRITRFVGIAFLLGYAWYIVTQFVGTGSTL